MWFSTGHRKTEIQFLNDHDPNRLLGIAFTEFGFSINLYAIATVLNFLLLFLQFLVDRWASHSLKLDFPLIFTQLLLC